MKEFKVIFIFSLAIFAFFLSNFYLKSLQNLELQQNRMQVLEEERQKVERLSISFKKNTVLEDNLRWTIQEIEKNPLDEEHVKQILLNLNKNFQPNSPDKKNPIQFWYLNNRNKQLLQWDKVPVKDRKIVEKTLAWFLEPKGETSSFQNRGRWRLFFGEKFKHGKVAQDPGKFHPIDFKGQGIHILYWQKIIDRKIRANGIQTDLALQKEKILGNFLCIINWTLFRQKLIGKLGVINSNWKNRQSKTSFFSPEDGLRRSMFPALEEKYILALEKEEKNLGVDVQHFQVEDTILTTIPTECRAKTWDYKTWKNTYLFQKQNKIGRNYLVSLRSLTRHNMEIENYYQKLTPGIWGLLIIFTLIFLYLELASFVGIKFKLTLILSLFVGVPFLLYFFYEVRTIQGSRRVKFLEKKKELANQLESIERGLGQQMVNLLELCRAFRDGIDFLNITEEQLQKIDRKFNEARAFENIVVYDRNFKPVFTGDKGKVGTKKENKIVKNLILQVWPYFVKMGKKAKNKFLSRISGEILSMVIGKNVLRLLVKINDFTQIQASKHILTLFLDDKKDNDGELKYLFAAVVKATTYFREIFESRAIHSHEKKEIFRFYFFDKNKQKLFPRLKTRTTKQLPDLINPERHAFLFQAFRDKANEEYVGYLEDDFEKDNLFAVRFIEKFGYLLAISYPKEPIEKELQDMQKKLSFNLSGIFFALVIGVLFFSYRILKPLNKIKEAMTAVETENFDFQLDIKTKDEIADLGKTFNKMLLGLAEREQLATQNTIFALKEKELQTELGVARDIQKLLYPEKMPTIDGYDFYGRCLSMEAVGGDYFDFIKMNKNQIAIIIGDVSGHGIPAALLMAMAKSGTLLGLTNAISPSDLLHSLNTLVFETMRRKRMMTYFIAQLDTVEHRIDFANAGHNYPLLLSNGEIRFMKSTSYPLGIKRKGKYQEVTQYISTGDILCFYTDGTIESVNEEKKPFGYERLQKYIMENEKKDARTIVEGFFEELKVYAAGTAYDDDITISIVKRTG
ncbi:SpoIIE family protein phosphatase [Candidatus Riflebacteria bacterium]